MDNLSINDATLRGIALKPTRRRRRDLWEVICSADRDSTVKIVEPERSVPALCVGGACSESICKTVRGGQNASMGQWNYRERTSTHQGVTRTVNPAPTLWQNALAGGPHEWKVAPEIVVWMGRSVEERKRCANTHLPQGLTSSGVINRREDERGRRSRVLERGVIDLQKN